MKVLFLVFLTWNMPDVKVGEGEDKEHTKGNQMPIVNIFITILDKYS